MTLQFKCKKCRADITVRFLKAGEQMKCPHCGAQNMIPETAIFMKEELPVADKRHLAEAEEKGLRKQFLGGEIAPVLVPIAAGCLLCLWLLPFPYNSLLLLPVAIMGGVLLWRFRSKRVIYSSAVVVLLIALGVTIGVSKSSTKTVSSVVFKKWKETRTGSDPSVLVENLLARVACKESKKGYLTVPPIRYGQFTPQ